MDTDKASFSITILYYKTTNTIKLFKLKKAYLLKIMLSILTPHHIYQLKICRHTQFLIELQFSMPKIWGYVWCWWYTYYQFVSYLAEKSRSIDSRAPCVVTGTYARLLKHLIRDKILKIYDLIVCSPTLIGRINYSNYTARLSFID